MDYRYFLRTAWLAAGCIGALADELHQTGYRTAIIGKWHLGLESPNTPNDRGFDDFQGFLGDMMDSYTDHRRHGENLMRHNREGVARPGNRRPGDRADNTTFVAV